MPSHKSTVGVGVPKFCLHDKPIFDWMSEIDQYLADKDVTRLNNVYWDIAMLNDNEIVGEATRSLNLHLVKLPLYADKPLFDLFEKFNYASYNRYHNYVVMDRLHRMDAATATDRQKITETSYESLMRYGRYGYYLNYLKTHRDKFGEYKCLKEEFLHTYENVQHTYENNELKNKYTPTTVSNAAGGYRNCLEKLRLLKDLPETNPEWYWVKYNDIAFHHYRYNYHAIVVRSRLKPTQEALSSYAHAIMCHERHCIMVNRIMGKNYEDYDKNQKTPIMHWVELYNQAIWHNVWTSGVNTIVFELLKQQVELFTTVDDVMFNAHVKTSLHEIYNKIGMYEKKQFSDRVRIMEDEIDPMTYLTHIYTARGFTTDTGDEQSTSLLKRLFGSKNSVRRSQASAQKATSSVMVDANRNMVRLERINSIDEIDGIIRQNADQPAFFHYLILNQEMTQEEASELDQYIYKTEMKYRLPPTYRIVYPDETGAHKCYGTFHGIIN